MRPMAETPPTSHQDPTSVATLCDQLHVPSLAPPTEKQHTQTEIEIWAQGIWTKWTFENDPGSDLQYYLNNAFGRPRVREMESPRYTDYQSRARLASSPLQRDFIVLKDFLDSAICDPRTRACRSPSFTVFRSYLACPLWCGERQHLQAVPIASKYGSEHCREVLDLASIFVVTSVRNALVGLSY